MHPANYSSFISTIENTQKPSSAILSEKFAIVTCSLLVAVFAIPMFVVIQALAANVWGTAVVCQLISSKGLSLEGEEF
jgi:hypothetical protein